jgi:hypothetical protein
MTSPTACFHLKGFEASLYFLLAMGIDLKDPLQILFL